MIVDERLPLQSTGVSTQNGMVGGFVGEVDTLDVGKFVGEAEGCRVGRLVGLDELCRVGTFVGVDELMLDGGFVGLDELVSVGAIVGADEILPVAEGDGGRFLFVDGGCGPKFTSRLEYTPPPHEQHTL